MFVQLPKGVYDNVQPGMFGLIRYTRTVWESFKPVYVEWYQCRDSFQYAWRRHQKHAWLNNSFFFRCNRKRVGAFLNCAEKALGLWKKSKVYSANARGMCGICPAPFWSKQEIRISLFTLLLRAAEHYKPGSDWKKCLFDHPYAQETKDAIEYFFGGHTVYLADNPIGWCYAFNPMYKQENHKHLLRRPKMSSIGRWFKSWFVRLR